MAFPSWIPPETPNVARVQTIRGDVLGMGPFAAELLFDRHDVEWFDAGEGWVCATYGEPEPSRNRRRCPWAVPLLISDGRGYDWSVPAILSPSGTPAIDMASRLTDQGWIEEPATPTAKRALAACWAMLTHARADTLHEIPLEKQNEAICAILEACYYLNALTIGRLGLITGTLRRHGIRAACGII